MEKALEKLRHDLEEGADSVKRKKNEVFFVGVKTYGLKNADVHRLSREHFRSLPDRSRNYVLRLCEELWKSGYIEESFVACDWSYAVRKQFEADDIKIFGNWVDRYVDNWASCDTLCNHTIGEPAMKFTSWIEDLKKWTLSQNRWMKRGAAVSLIIPARKGLFLEDIFEIALRMLKDKDDMVQKGYGWMLKSASEAHQQEVYEFILKYKDKMPRTSLRYAIEKMPQEMKTEAMRR
jgi:3-methyladenine DNA glycosylase AlkD